jgi:hypothetical protein
MIKFKVTCKKDSDNIYMTTVMADNGISYYNISFAGRNGSAGFFKNLTFYLNQAMETLEN